MKFFWAESLFSVPGNPALRETLLGEALVYMNAD
jgi:hypothetical protein